MDIRNFLNTYWIILMPILLLILCVLSYGFNYMSARYTVMGKRRIMEDGETIEIPVNVSNVSNCAGCLSYGLYVFIGFLLASYIMGLIIFIPIAQSLFFYGLAIAACVYLFYHISRFLVVIAKVLMSLVIELFNPPPRSH